MKLEGRSAIGFAEDNGLLLNKYADPIEGAREGLSVEEAEEIGREGDLLLIWLEIENPTMRNLDELCDAMQHGDARVHDRYGQWSSSLPTFGGEEPADTLGIWSWDETRLLVGTCADDLRIVERVTEPCTCTNEDSDPNDCDRCRNEAYDANRQRA